MIVVDSSVWIDSLRDRATPHVALLHQTDADELIIGDLIMLEVLRGARTEAEATMHEQRFRALGIVTLSNPDLAVVAARNYRKLRALGITIRSSVDVMIATFCIERGHQLLHSDRDFEHFERHLGLSVVR